MTESDPVFSPASSVDTDKRQDNSLWLQMWRDDKTQGFHQTSVNPLLARYWQSQNLKQNSRILVPLCGKSLDMLWLAAQGYRVVGIELSPVAVKAFFVENKLKVKKTRKGNFTCWQSGPIVIWCGDFFSIHKNRLGRIDGVFDRAALTALPEAVREPYISHLRALIDDDVEVMLLTVEDVTKESGQTAGHIDSEITSLYREYFDIRLTYTERENAVAEEFYTDTKVYRMSKWTVDISNGDTMKTPNKINYIELPARNLEGTKEFFSAAFGWSFVDYGPDYSAMEDAGLDGGFYRSEQVATTANGSALVVLYSDNLEASLAKVKACGGTILKDIFLFPGGRRFQFADPSGNEYGVWAEPTE